MAGTLGGFFIEIGADISEFEKKIKAVQRGLNQAVGRDFARLAGQVRTLMMGAAGALGIVGVAAVKSAARFEQQRIAFTSLLKSGDKATEMLKEIQRFAAATPFQFDDLVVASKKMLAFGFEAEKVLPTLRTVGDAAAGLGLGADGIDRITRALGQMKQKGKVSAQEINQLAEAGIGAWEYLATAAGKSVAEVQKASEKGLISGKAGVAAILAGMDSQFAGLMEKQSTTINGILSNITDNVGEAMRGIGQGLIDNLPIKETLAGLRDEIGKFSAQITNSGFRQAFELTFDRLASPEIRAGLAALAAVIGTTLVYSIAQFTLALGRMMTVHPYLLAFTAAVSGIYYAFQRWEETIWILETYWSNLKVMFANGGAVIVDTVRSFAGSIAGFFAQGLALMLQMTSRTLAQIAQELRNTLPAGFGWIADSVFAVARATKTGYMEAWKAGNDFYTKSKAASDRAAAAFKKANQEVLDGYNKRKQAAESLAKWHELELTYGKRIGEAFDRAKETIVSGYAAIKSAGASAWASGIAAAAGYIDKLIQVTNYMNLVAQAAAALSAAFSMGIGGDGGGAPAPVVPPIDLGGGGSKGGGGGKGKSAAEEAREALDLYRETFREFRDLQKELRAPQAGAAGLFQQLDDEIMGVRDHWVDALDEIAAKWDETSKAGRDSIIKAMQEAGIQYQVAENGKLDLSRQRLRIETELEQEKQRRRLEIINSGQALEAELDKLANERNLTGYTQHLDSKRAAFLANLEGERQAMDTYRQLMMEANRSSLSYMAEAAQTLTSGLTDAIVGVVTGTKKASEAFKDLGKQIITMVIRWMVQRAVSAAMAKTLEKGMAASSAASAAVINAAWAPAAANVAIATMGGAIGPAMAGLMAATSSYRAMSAVGLAKGGIVTGPTMAMIGEGRDDEAVIPLNDRILSKIGGGGKGNVQVIVNNQTGVRAAARAETTFDAQGSIVTIWLDALDRNVGNLRDQVAAVRG
jgi:tape measure domain-containing protein